MRRVFAWLLLVVFLGQASTASALAGTAGSIPELSTNLGQALEQLRALIPSNPLIGLLLVNGGGLRSPFGAAPSSKRFRPVVRQGGRPEPVLKFPPPPLARPKDQLAIRYAAMRLHLGGQLHGAARNSVSRSRAPRSIGAMAATRQGITTSGLTTADDSGAGISKWWRYEEMAIPGVGQSMVNVGTGNLVVVASDVDIPEPGIDLAFHRVYNSQSMHDFNADDGSEPAIFGERWTNNFDAHTVYRPSQGVISVYDIDGTRCDYTAQTDGSWQPCAGEHATLVPEGTGDCNYYWTKPSGTYYVFHAPAQNLSGNGSCGIVSGNIGRLSEIDGRNHNNKITITPTYPASGPKAAETLMSLLVQHSDGDSMTLTFGTVNGGPNELASITLPPSPNGKNVVYYSYDANGNLVEVDKPGNNMTADPATKAALNAAGVPAGDLPETYTTNATQLIVCGPRASISQTTFGTPSTTTDGACIFHDFDAYNNVVDRFVKGVLNPQMGDYAGGKLQPPLGGGVVKANEELFTFAPSTTTFSDWLGHHTVWTIDASFRVTATQETTGDPGTGVATLTTKTVWDSSNNPIRTTDARGNATDYAYDSNGNTTIVALPTSGVTQPSSVRPTSLYSYDAFNNLTAYCDPAYTDSINGDWQGTGYTAPTKACPTSPSTGSTTKAAVYVYNNGNNAPSYEPYGRLTDTYTPMGYHRSIVYAANSQGGTDLGLPTSVTGDTMSQDDNKGSRTPQETFTYNANGTLASYTTGNGQWNITSYDSMNRPLIIVDPDTRASYKCYYMDGSIEYTETPAQHADDGPLCNEGIIQKPAYAVQYTYDTDGDVSSETHHHMMGPGVPAETPAAVPGVTQKFYDGLDRLVGVQQPQDPSADIYKFPWVTRYIYDYATSQGPNTVAIGPTNGVSVPGLTAYGQLYKTQECLPQSAAANNNTGSYTSCSIQDVRGNSFDALDRSTAKYELSLGSGAESAQQYDANNYWGLLTKSSVGAAGQYTTFTYDAAGRIKVKTHDNPSVTPTESFQYDLDGRTAQIASSLFGPENYIYDADARLMEKDDPAPGASVYADPGQIHYNYYADGTRRSVVLTVPALAISAVKELGYSYFPDGHLRTEQVFAGDGGSYSWQYTPAGRELTQRDPSTGSTVNVYDKTGNSYTTKTFVAKTTTYDSYGQLSSIGFPSNMSMGPFVFDAEGNVLSDMPTQQTIYTTRGEVAAQSMGTLWPSANPANSTANGTSCMTTCTFSTTSGQMIAASTATFPGWSGLLGGSSTYYNDNAGRTIKVVEKCNADQYPEFDNTKTRTYDAESHTLTSSMTGPAYSAANQAAPGNSCDRLPYGNFSYTWGNSGHPYVTNVTQTGGAPLTPPAGMTSYHWDGDQILYDGTYLYIGLLGRVALTGPGGVLTFDRDYSGTQVQEHSVNQVNGVPVGHYTAYAPPGAMLQTDSAKVGPVALFPDSLGGNLPSPNLVAPPISPRGDGYMLGDIAIQGVRAYDPTSAQWTTPDAYSGDVHDPMSQKPFMYNNNDPVQYQDPSGYCASFAQCIIQAAQAAATATAAGAGAAAAAPVAVPLAIGGALGAIIAPAPLADDSQSGYEAAHPEYASRSRIVGEGWPQQPGIGNLPRGGELPYDPPKGGPRKVESPRGWGWLDSGGRVWVPPKAGGRHGAPHWDVQLPGGQHVNVPMEVPEAGSEGGGSGEGGSGGGGSSGGSGP